MVCFRFDVASAFAPVSPRGSAPRLELLRRCRMPDPEPHPILCEVDLWCCAESRGYVSDLAEEAIVFKGVSGQRNVTLSVQSWIGEGATGFAGVRRGTQYCN